MIHPERMHSRDNKEITPEEKAYLATAIKMSKVLKMERGDHDYFPPQRLSVQNYNFTVSTNPTAHMPLSFDLDVPIRFVQLLHRTKTMVQVEYASLTDNYVPQQQYTGLTLGISAGVYKITGFSDPVGGNIYPAYSQDCLLRVDGSSVLPELFQRGVIGPITYDPATSIGSATFTPTGTNGILPGYNNKTCDIVIGGFSNDPFVYNISLPDIPSNRDWVDTYNGGKYDANNDASVSTAVVDAQPSSIVWTGSSSKLDNYFYAYPQYQHKVNSNEVGFPITDTQYLNNNSIRIHVEGIDLPIQPTSTVANISFVFNCTFVFYTYSGGE